ncbi:hypothetical protein [Halobellus sp. GM3]|uniref:hypothetical protein n=1 Tax=Halobellus sp. GM3 TaxID=3458410 RepID=UPI00403E09D8
MNASRLLTIAVVVTLIGMAAVPMAASAETDLAVDVDQRSETGEAVVTVTANDSALENATVDVTSDSPYAGNGTYETDANGTVVLPNPTEAVSVQVNATANETTASQRVELVPHADSLDVSADQTSDGTATVRVTQYDDPVENATVNVSSASAYAGNGTYETDVDGELTLPVPNETVSIDLSAAANGADASASIELLAPEDALDVDATQADDGTTTVTVTQYGDPVENASVQIEAESDLAGNYTTDGAGTVTLDQPEVDQTVTVTATLDTGSAETTVDLVGYAQLEVTAEQRDDGVFVTVTHGSDAVENASVEVEADGDYSGVGTYATDGDGEVALPLPQENVTITVTAAAENETATTTTDLTVAFVEERGPFGLAVSQFVDALRTAGFDGPPGQVISDFVTGNNPGNANGNGAADRGGDDGNETANATAENESDDAPGRSDDARGQGASAADSDDAPGRSDGAPGRSGGASDRSNDTARGSDDAPGRSGDAPGRSGGDSESAADDGESRNGDDEASASDDDADGSTQSDDSGNARSADRGSDGGSGNGGDAPGNSGDAPGRN